MKDAGGPLHPSSLPGGGGCCHGVGKQGSPPPSDGNVSTKEPLCQVALICTHHEE